LGASARETISVLREQGLGYRYTDFLRDYREHLSVSDKLSRIKYTRNDYILSSSVHSEIPQFLSNRYKYDVTYTLQSVKTGRIFDFQTSVSSDEAMNKRSLYTESRKAVAKMQDQTDVEIISEGVSGAWHEMGESY
jgi:hypothetical protein